ncbi:MAG: MXAN_5187 C-terminal domain-containing protein [Polyangiaceae bacterium]
MEPSELDKNLGELEEKMERVRALYEQYFMGLEKLEPQIPRKDVDRRIVLLRKEQIRNTAMRFKFQTLVQRYNTLQQHWMRTMREIENGTFKRDLMKAAARFGVDDALTALGKRHAARLRGVVDRRKPKREEVYEELSSSDLEFADDLRAELGDALNDDDDAPTPPPQQQRVFELTEADAAPGYAADFGPTHTGDELATTAPHPAAAAPSAEDSQQKPLRHLFPKARGPKPRAIELPAEPPPINAGFGIIDPLEALPPSEVVVPAQAGASVVPASSGAPAKKGGLRWGGGGARKADPEALRRMASLAGVQEAPPFASRAGEAPPFASRAGEAPPFASRAGEAPPFASRAGEAPPVASRAGEAPPVASRAGEAPPFASRAGEAPPFASKAGEAPAAAPEPVAAPAPRKPLLSRPLDLGIPDEPTVSPNTAPERPAPEVRKPLLSSPIDIDLGLPPSEPPPPPPVAKPAAVRPAPPEPAAAPEAGEMRRPQPARLRPPDRTADQVPAAPAASKAAEASKREFGDLNDGRLREIYAQYVQARRERNESTAGITFEKLSDSLKSQAEKLKGVHKKRVDYEVVVKDGKTLIKPIVK